MTFKFFITIFVLALIHPHSAMANSVNDEALNLASQKKFAESLKLLSNQTQVEKSQYDHRFLKARILSWSGSYKAARLELDLLLSQYPNNADLLLALANLEYYENNLEAAQTVYEEVLILSPNYLEAQKGLENVNKAQLIYNESNNKWRLDVGYSFSGFDQENLPNWNEQFLGVQYSTQQFSYNASINSFDRFGMNDLSFKVGVSDAVRGGWDWGVNFGISPEGNFRPKTGIEGRVGHALNGLSGLVLYPNLLYKYDQYSETDIHTIVPDLTAYLRNGTIISARTIATIEKSEETKIGWLVEGRQPIGNDLQIRLGYAYAPDALNGVVIRTESIFGGVTYDVNDNFDVHLNLSRDDRENSFVREGVNVAVTYKR